MEVFRNLPLQRTAFLFYSQKHEASIPYRDTGLFLVLLYLFIFRFDKLEKLIGLSCLLMPAQG